jgi:hypothetical protein
MDILRTNMRTIRNIILLALILAAHEDSVRADSHTQSGLRLENGWFVHNGRVVWGNAQHNAWWTPTEGANLTRRMPGVIGPNRTEDLDKLTDNMLRYGYPGFEHNFGLWYDRRRDAHDTARRTDTNAMPPFLEQPWARIGEGAAWDGLPKYDLTVYNPWYFDRLKEFAALCDRKGTILFHNYYMQHALLEGDPHYVDFPWRPTNCLQQTDMPEHVPAANVFYDASHPVRRELHRAYIRKCLDELSGHTNVIHLLSEEYTGPLAFMQFWLDVVTEWEREKHKDVLVGIGGTKDVLDALAGDDRVSVLNLQYWWYEPDGSLYAPLGGKQIAGRYAMGKDSSRTTPQAIYRQMREYRLRYPNKGLLHHINASRQQSWAFLMGGGSMLIRFLPYAGGASPTNYIAPEDTVIVQPIYDFINRNLSTRLQKMVPLDVVNNPDRNWCLGQVGETYLVYALTGGSFTLDLSKVNGTFWAKWFDPRTGKIQVDATQETVRGGKVITFTAPGTEDWVLWLQKDAVSVAH